MHSEGKEEKIYQEKIYPKNVLTKKVCMERKAATFILQEGFVE